jgi:hypothetical protein
LPFFVNLIYLTKKEEESSIEEEKKDETELLYDEATMPLEEVLKRYKKTENKVKKVLDNKKSGGISASAKPYHPSPNISGSSSSMSAKRKQRLKDALDAYGVIEESKLAASGPIKPPPITSSADFQKQEELDINEIKKNSLVLDAENHEQDYDEASNLVSLNLFVLLYLLIWTQSWLKLRVDQL